jgi:hypothetical protein
MKKKRVRGIVVFGVAKMSRFLVFVFCVYIIGKKRQKNGTKLIKLALGLFVCTTQS